MPNLTDEERKCLLRLIETGSPLGLEWLEKLFPPLLAGELWWQGKFHASARAQNFLDECAKNQTAGEEEPTTPGPFRVLEKGVSASHCQHFSHAISKSKDTSGSKDVSESKGVSGSKDVREDGGDKTPFTHWAGLLLQGDNLNALHYLLQNNHSLGLAPSPFSLIYIDPPFFSETDFHARVPRAARETAPAGTLEQEFFAYSDTWQGGKSEYFSMLYERLKLIHALLTPNGVVCVHCDWRAVPGMRFILDECFGQESFINEIIWHYTGGGRSKRYFSRKHDSILVYGKGKEWTFNIDAVRVPYKKTSGYAKSGIVSKGGKRYMPHPLGTPLDDVWDIPMVNPMAKERVAYATQKPLLLLERVIQAFSNENDVIGDFFCGSGTTMQAALGLNRRVIGCDFGTQAIEVTHKRLVEKGFSAEKFPLFLSEQQGQKSLACHVFYSLK